MLRSSLLAAAFLMLGCGSPFFLEAKATAVCQHLPAQRFQVPSELREQLARLPPSASQGLALEHTFDFDVSAQLPPEVKDMVQSHFALTSVRLTVVNPGDDLGFVDEAHLQLLPAAASGLEARKFDYVRAEPTPHTVSWNGQAFDVGAYLESGNLKYSVSLVGSLPPGDIVVDVDACAEASVRVDYLQ
jgi:hypothetical protein